MLPQVPSAAVWKIVFYFIFTHVLEVCVRQVLSTQNNGIAPLPHDSGLSFNSAIDHASYCRHLEELIRNSCWKLLLYDKSGYTVQSNSFFYYDICRSVEYLQWPNYVLITSIKLLGASQTLLSFVWAILFLNKTSKCVGILISSFEICFSEYVPMRYFTSGNAIIV